MNNIIELNITGFEPIDETCTDGNTIAKFDACLIDESNRYNDLNESKNDLIINIGKTKLYLYISDDLIRIYNENENETFEVNKKDTNSTTLAIDVK
jgi:hypothetical protein